MVFKKHFFFNLLETSSPIFKGNSIVVFFVCFFVFFFVLFLYFFFFFLQVSVYAGITNFGSNSRYVFF